MSDDFQDQVQAEIDRTGLDEVTAAKIVSGRMADRAAELDRDPASSHITSSIWAALTAPPTANEPSVLPPSPPSCADCGGAGYYKEAVPFGHPNFGKPFPCHCKQAETTQHQLEQQTAILERLDDELGSELRHCTFASFGIARGSTVQHQRTLAAALSAAKDYTAAWRGWLYLHGPCGVGKSHLAAAIAHAAVERGMRVSYASVPSLLRFLKGGFGDRSSDARLLALQVVELLVLDDIGAEYHSKAGDWTDSTLFELINYRYLYGGLTVLTSNVPPEELEPRIGSRIRGKARVVLMVNTDQRGPG